MKPKCLKEDEETYQTPKPDIIIEDPLLKKGFIQLPLLILKNPTLSFGAKLTYALLLSYAWQNPSCFPGQSRLASDLGVSDRSIRQFLSELSPHYISIKRRGLGKSNTYLIKQLKKSSPDRKPASALDRKPASYEVYSVEVDHTKPKKTSSAILPSPMFHRYPPDPECPNCPSPIPTHDGLSHNCLGCPQFSLSIFPTR